MGSPASTRGRPQRSAPPSRGGWGGRGVALSTLLLLTGCWSSPVNLEPAKRPPDFIAHKVVDPSTGQVFESGEAIAGGRVTVKLFKTGTSDRVGDAKVTLIGPTLASGTSTSQLDLALQPLKPGSYQVRVEAPGYATLLSDPFTVDATNPTTVQYDLGPSAGDVTGRALDTGTGQPLAGAWVSVGEAYAYTDANGSFRLKGAPTGAREVTLGRTGYAPAAVPATLGAGETALGDVRLTTRERSVYLENATQNFGGRALGTALGDLTTSLQGAGFTIQSTANNPAIRIVASPTAAGMGDVAAASERLRTFVAAGGKLVLMGEWGGFADYDPDTLNRLAQPYGIAFNPDLVRLGGTTPNWIKIPSVSGPMPAVSPVTNGIELFESCSLLAPTPAVPIASTGSGGFRVSALLNGDFSVTAARPYGRGMVVAVGDTSAWVTPATTGNGSNLDVQDNRAFILDLFRW